MNKTGGSARNKMERFILNYHFRSYMAYQRTAAPPLLCSTPWTLSRSLPQTGIVEDMTTTKWRDTDGFHSFGTFARDCRVALLNDLRQTYPAFYVHSGKWYTRTAQSTWDKIYTYKEIKKVGTTFSNNETLRDAFHGWLFGRQSNKLTIGEANLLVMDLSRLVRFTGREAPTLYCDSSPTLAIVEILDPGLKKLAGGKSKCLVREMDVYSYTPSRLLCDRMRTTVQLMYMNITWPLAVCLHYSLPMDFFAAPYIDSDGSVSIDKRRPHTYIFEDYCETNLATMEYDGDIVTRRWFVGMIFQFLFAFHAGTRLFGFSHEEAIKHIMFSDVSDTPLANRPWAYRFRGSNHWYLLSPEAHQNKLLKLIDFGYSSTTSLSDLKRNELHDSLIPKEYPVPILHQTAEMQMKMLDPGDIDDDDYSFLVRDLENYWRETKDDRPFAFGWADRDYFKYKNTITRVPSEGLLPVHIYEIPSETPANKMHPALVGYIPDAPGTPGEAIMISFPPKDHKIGK